MPPSLMQGGGRKAAQLLATTGRFFQPAGDIPPKFLRVPAGVRRVLDGRHV
jgi:hypothetical protein